MHYFTTHSMLQPWKWRNFFTVKKENSIFYFLAGGRGSAQKEQEYRQAPLHLLPPRPVQRVPGKDQLFSQLLKNRHWWIGLISKSIHIFFLEKHEKNYTEVNRSKKI